MKEKTKKIAAAFAGVLGICLMLGMALPVAAASTPESDVSIPIPEGEVIAEVAEQPDTVAPNTLIINLGPEWAATEFEVASESGSEVQVIRVSPEGSLTLELDGSYIYTLSMDAERSSVTGFADALIPQSEEGADDSQPDEEPAPAPEDQEADEGTLLPGIPNQHLFLFAGGLLICIAALVIMAILKRRRNSAAYEDEDEDYDDE